MSDSDSEKDTKCTESNKKTKILPRKIKELKNFNTDEIFKYIEDLHELLKRSGKKIRKYKEKIKKLIKEINKLKETPKEISALVKPESPSLKGDVLDNELKSEDADAVDAAAAFSFVAEIRQAAEAAQNLNGFVYEPTSGLYYDQKTGYYYNAEYGLYYDGNTGCYYSYNQEKKTFEFHSQVEVQPSQSACQDDDDDDGDDDEVHFDEWGGVITDPKKLRDIREQKELLKQEKEEKKHESRERKKQIKKQALSDSPKSKSSKKLKRSRRNSATKSLMGSSNSESELDAHTRAASKRRHLEIEDGELSSSSESSSSSSNSSDRERNDKNKVRQFKSGGRFQDIAKKYPPCLRIIVQESCLDKLKVGSLNLITYKGGTLGREGNHDVIIPDLNVSKYHLKFSYDTKEAVYKCVDLGSRNGTILNGSRMCAAKTESDPLDVVHGSTIQIGQTKLLCHVHEGNSTCGLCEPGLLIETTRESANTSATPAVVLSHKEQLKKLQKKYGLENEKFVDGKTNANNYNDRAATRRIKVGSSTDNEKTQTATVTTEISSENKGFKMLSKLGWSKGEALGKTNASTGLLEPINVSSNEGKKGLGCDDAGVGRTKLTVADKKKIEKWKKAQERYQKAEDIFYANDEASVTELKN